MPYYCHVCGLESEYESGDWDICECCGYEPGFDGQSPQQVRRYREEWLNKGAKWFASFDVLRRKPPNWDLQAQFQNIPLEFQ